MGTRELINFFYSRASQQTEPLPSAASSVEAEFNWPPSAEDLKDYSVVRLRADNGSEIQPVVVGFSDVAKPAPTSTARGRRQPRRRM